MEKKGTLASPATALASKVLPVPGGPTSSTPLGILAPSSRYFLGSFKKSTISFSSSFSSSAPATSAKVILFLLGSTIFAWLLPKLITLEFPPVCWRIIIYQNTMTKPSGIRKGIISIYQGVTTGGRYSSLSLRPPNSISFRLTTAGSTSFFDAYIRVSVSIKSAPMVLSKSYLAGKSDSDTRLGTSRPYSVLPRIATRATLPSAMFCSRSGYFTLGVGIEMLSDIM